jgi:hypothetical protein
MLAFDSRGLTNSNEGEAKVMNSVIGHVMLDTEILAKCQSPWSGSPCGSIYSGR